MLGKVLVLVRDDQLSLAIGRRGQNVRLASKLVGWDINVMTQESLDEQLDISIEAFSIVPEMSPELVENLVSQGFFTFDDLSVIEPDQLAELGGLTQEQCDTIVDFADVESLRLEEEERLAEEERKRNPPPPPEPEAAGGAEPAAETDASSEDGAAESEETVSAETADQESSSTTEAADASDQPEEATAADSDESVEVASDEVMVGVIVAAAESEEDSSGDAEDVTEGTEESEAKS